MLSEETFLKAILMKPAACLFCPYIDSAILENFLTSYHWKHLPFPHDNYLFFCYCVKCNVPPDWKLSPVILKPLHLQLSREASVLEWTFLILPAPSSSMWWARKKYGLTITSADLVQWNRVMDVSYIKRVEEAVTKSLRLCKKAFAFKTNFNYVLVYSKTNFVID
ncbi:hypothetical protein C0J52_25452 [Blattella germanica]|nr:hypothetical protein C0J52_25452 [Blattella germanica]